MKHDLKVRDFEMPSASPRGKKGGTRNGDLKILPMASTNPSLFAKCCAILEVCLGVLKRTRVRDGERRRCVPLELSLSLSLRSGFR